MNQIQKERFLGPSVIEGSFFGFRNTHQIRDAILAEFREQRSVHYPEASANLPCAEKRLTSAIHSLLTHEVPPAGFELLKEALIHTRLTDNRLRVLVSAIRSLSPWVKDAQSWQELQQAMLCYHSTATPGCDLMQKIANAVSKPKLLAPQDRRLLLKYLARSARELVEGSNPLRDDQSQNEFSHLKDDAHFTRAIDEYLALAKNFVLEVSSRNYPEEHKQHGLELYTRNAHQSKRAEVALHQYKQLLEGSQVQGLSGRLQTAISAEFKACWQAGKTQDHKPANPFSSVEGQADSILSSNLLTQSLRDFWFQAGQQDQHAAALFLKHSVVKLLAGPLDSDLVERISDIGIKILNNHSLELVDKQERLSFCIDYLLAIQKQSEPGREFKLALFSQVLLTPEGLPRFPSALICVEQELMQAISRQTGSAAAFIDDRLLYSENAIKALCYSSTMLGEQSPGSRFSSQRAPLMFATLADDLQRHVIDRLCERPELIKCFLLENKGAVLSHLFYESPDLLDRLLDRLAESPEQLKYCLTTSVIGKRGAADLIAMMMANPLSKENVWLRMQQAHMTRAEQVNAVVCINLSPTLYLNHDSVKKECDLLTSALQGNGKPVKHFPKPTDTAAMQALSNVYSKLIGLGNDITNPDTNAALRGTLFRSLIEHEAGDWLDMDRRLASQSIRSFANVKDLCKCAATWLVLPEMYRRLPEASQHALDARKLEALLEHTVLEIAAALFSGRSMSKMLALSDAWHRNLALVNDRMRDIAESGSWRPLLKERIIEIPDGQLAGWKVINLTSAAELKNEGQQLHHCVGSYANKALAGNTHILSIRDPDNRSQSTLELSLSYSPGQRTPDLRVCQHQGAFDKAPPENSEKVREWLFKEIASGNVKLNSGRFGEVFAVTATTIPAAVKLIGFVPGKERNQQAFERFGAEIRVGRRSHIIPRKFIHGSYQDFLQQTGLMEMIEKLVNSLQGSSDQN